MAEVDRILTRSSAAAVQTETKQRGGVLLWTVTENPTDFRGLFIIRPHLCESGAHRPLMCHIEAETLEAARAMLPPELYNLGKSTLDDPAIVEVWI